MAKELSRVVFSFPTQKTNQNKTKKKKKKQQKTKQKKKQNKKNNNNSNNSVSFQCACGKSSIARTPEVHPISFKW